MSLVLDDQPLTDFVPLSELPKHLPSGRRGKRIHASTIWRWAHHGVLRDGQRIKLETSRIGGTYYTSPDAVVRFLAALSQPELPTRSYGQTSRQRMKRINSAKKALEKHGI